MAALSGVNTIGKAKPENSGYDGGWSDAANQGIFNNDYYKSMLVKGWGPKRAVGGNVNKNQWQLIDESPDSEKKSQMMLNTDMCLVYQDNPKHAECMKQNKRNFRKCIPLEKKGGFLNAKTSSCWAWTQFNVLFKKKIWTTDKDYCGISKADFINTLLILSFIWCIMG